MNVEYSGWTSEQGFFRFLIPLDEKREDYEIHLPDGRIVRQKTSFQDATYDWNHDDDIYTQFGAWFDWDGCGEFLTPVDLVSMVLEGKAEIPGIQNPLRRPTLDEKLHKADESKCLASKHLDCSPLER